ncbi:MAG TPA: hypothetical protein EYP69_02085 [Bacteroidales bacterium]|nr:hypothetical protein [Bacteroidales bacterium]
MKTAQKLISVFGNRVLGPTEPIITKIKNLYIMEILLKIERNKSQSKAKELLHTVVKNLQQQPFFSGIVFHMEVD